LIDSQRAMPNLTPACQTRRRFERHEDMVSSQCLALSIPGGEL